MLIERDVTIGNNVRSPHLGMKTFGYPNVLFYTTKSTSTQRSAIVRKVIASESLSLVHHPCYRFPIPNTWARPGLSGRTSAPLGNECACCFASPLHDYCLISMEVATALPQAHDVSDTYNQIQLRAEEMNRQDASAERLDSPAPYLRAH